MFSRVSALWLPTINLSVASTSMASRLLRGIPQIEVTFDIDANGIINVTAQDKATSRSQHITITASSGLSESEVEKMRRDAEQHADEDRRKKELIEARNTADSTIYTAEKLLKDMGDKIPAEMKTQVEDKVARLRSAVNDSDPEPIQKAVEELNQVIQQVGASAYQQTPPEPEPQPGPAGDQSGPGPSASGEDVVDGEFHSA